jgi:hypothetical protein
VFIPHASLALIARPQFHGEIPFCLQFIVRVLPNRRNSIFPTIVPRSPATGHRAQSFREIRETRGPSPALRLVHSPAAEGHRMIAVGALSHSKWQHVPGEGSCVRRAAQCQAAARAD